MSDRAAVSPDPGRSAGCGERFRDEKREGDMSPGDSETMWTVSRSGHCPVTPAQTRERRSLLITAQLVSLSLNILSTSTGCLILLKVNSCFERVLNFCISI